MFCNPYLVLARARACPCAAGLLILQGLAEAYSVGVPPITNPFATSTVAPPPDYRPAGADSPATSPFTRTGENGMHPRPRSNSDRAPHVEEVLLPPTKLYNTASSSR